MEMGRGMLIKKHSNDDSEKPANLRHGLSFPHLLPTSATGRVNVLVRALVLRPLPLLQVALGAIELPLDNMMCPVLDIFPRGLFRKFLNAPYGNFFCSHFQTSFLFVLLRPRSFPANVAPHGRAVRARTVQGLVRASYSFHKASLSVFGIACQRTPRIAPSSPASMLRHGGSSGRMLLILIAAATAPIRINCCGVRMPAAARSRAASRPIFGMSVSSDLLSKFFIIIFARAGPRLSGGPEARLF